MRDFNGFFGNRNQMEECHSLDPGRKTLTTQGYLKELWLRCETSELKDPQRYLVFRKLGTSVMKSRCKIHN